ncbi:MAG: tyrosine--tRNA ligase [Candidatus Diapherotrites archaeon]|nr:tyrosine--tRNA ligase [Candidatus Diapherotrites archaeon]
MDSERVFELITRNTEEVLTAEDLRQYIEAGLKLKHYIGFEISGRVHLGTGLLTMSKVVDLIKANVDVSIFLADWHTWINDKLGGDRETIIKVAKGYFKESLIAGIKCNGGDPKKVKFVLASDLYKENDEYWATVVDVSKNCTLARIMRSITIMGRKEGSAIDFAKLIYPPMQVADIYFQGINIAHAGIDQRKAHVIAREVALKLKIRPLLDNNGNKIKPVAIHTPLLAGLCKPPIWPIPREKAKEMLSELKMSKSQPDSCIFIHDTEEEIRRKLSNAFCCAGEVCYNPILNWAKNIIFAKQNAELIIKRPAKFGGNVTYKSYDLLEKDFLEKKLHPLDLKNAVAEKIIEILEPARKHFKKPRQSKMLQEVEWLTRK